MSSYGLWCDEPQPPDYSYATADVGPPQVGVLTLRWFDVKDEFEGGTCRTGWHLSVDGLGTEFWDQGGIVTIQHPPSLGVGTGWIVGPSSSEVWSMQTEMVWEEELRDQYVVTAIDAYGTRYPIPGPIPEQRRR